MGSPTYTWSMCLTLLGMLCCMLRAFGSHRRQHKCWQGTFSCSMEDLGRYLSLLNKNNAGLDKLFFICLLCFVFAGKKQMDEAPNLWSEAIPRSSSCCCQQKPAWRTYPWVITSPPCPLPTRLGDGIPVPLSGRTERTFSPAQHQLRTPRKLKRNIKTLQDYICAPILRTD